MLPKVLQNLFGRSSSGSVLRKLDIRTTSVFCRLEDGQESAKLTFCVAMGV